ncbi:probable cytochrome P450 6a14 isoform X2 [Cephus cinctus]|uniref:Probable cytochrome P450 6a14 isoform X2 n=1 Tax=Cephus cinctus TaxID=211228 RepID=A0AAJ7RLI7_CEPCN|nr:probable cytochrome P450 6a14 isoform X2 [Cephus cinctus]
MMDIFNQFLDPFLLTGFLIGVLYFYFIATFDFWANNGVPYRKPTLLLGNFGPLLLFKKSQQDGIYDMYNWFKNERYFGVYRVRSPIFILRDPDLVKSVCVKDFSCFPNRGIPVNTQDPLSGHLFNLEGKKWKGLRSKLTPTFSSGKIKRMFYLLVECSEEFQKLIRHSATGAPVEVRELAAKFTIDVIGSCAFGIQINALANEDSEFRIMAILDENSIAAQAFVFFAAGYETSSTSISFCLHELALNPQIQEKLREDILQGIEKHDGKLNYDSIQEMKYLDMVVQETLRKYPPAPLMSRRCEYPYQVPGTKIELPAGMRVVIPTYGLHHDPDHYPNPEQFIPERFTDENKRTRHPYTYLPFGEGPRNCIGMRFALLQTKVGIISFVKNHRVEVCEKTTVPIKFSKRSLVTTSEGGFWLKISPLE